MADADEQTRDAIDVMARHLIDRATRLAEAPDAHTLDAAYEHLASRGES